MKYHAASGKFDPLHGFAKAAPGKPTFTQVFGQWLCDMADADERLIGITPAMREGSGMVEFQKRHPKRFYDVGIAEQHAVTFAAGLACEGLKPVVAIYSTFLQRGYDQMVHDVAIQNLPVVFALDRAGIVGADGATHIGAYDIAFIRCMPNMSLLTPADENECRQALSTAFRQEHPVAVRYPRGSGVGTGHRHRPVGAALGPGRAAPQHRQAHAVGGPRIAILAFGTLLYPALQAAEALDATVVNMRFVKPLDVAMVLEMARSHEAIVTVEEGCVMGGAGSAVRRMHGRHGLAVPLLQLGLPDEFIEHGDPNKLLSMCGLDAAGIEQSMLKRFGSRLTVVRPAANHLTLARQARRPHWQRTTAIDCHAAGAAA